MTVNLYLDGRLLKIPPELGQLRLPLLVKLNLCGGGATGLVQALGEVVKFPINHDGTVVLRLNR